MPGRIDVREALGTIGQRDHSITAEYRIFGPPGTGKTTSVTQLIHQAVERFGADSVLVTSFSRAAAAELAGKDLPISGDRVGTLHSHCWYALGRPEIAEVHVQEWNRVNPGLRLTALKKDRKLAGEEPDEESGIDLRNGDHLLSEMNRCRGMMLPVDQWSARVRQFADKWNRYKKCRQLLDFCDLIDIAKRDIRVAPNKPDVIFADEAQDLNPLQLALVRQWGEHAQYFVIAADDDQTIYGWCGATPEGVLDPAIPDDHTLILQQSYRVPRSVHERANRLIRQVTRRQEKVYDPRPEQGSFLQLSTGGYKSPEYWLLKTMMQHLENGQKVMVLASCSYMLQPIIAVLRQRGIPFHNPYRKSNGHWNPLRLARKESAANRILSLLEYPHWTYGGLKLWTEWLNAKGNLRPGAKSLLQDAEESLVVTTDRLIELFEPGMIDALLAARGDHRRLLKFLSGRLAPEFRARSQFPIAIALAGGRAALEEDPQVVVGTIHSVKGGEADVVFLFPDLSPAGDATYQRPGPQRDSILRLFYVGMTRARNTLYICQRESQLAVGI